MANIGQEQPSIRNMQVVSSNRGQYMPYAYVASLTQSWALKLARAVGVQVGQWSGSRLAMTLVATINIIFRPPVHFFSKNYVLEQKMG